MRATLYRASWVVPVTSAPIADGVVLVNDRGVIEAVDAASRVTVGDDVAIIDLGDAILLPGLINVHTHPELCGLRGLLEDLPFQLWIPSLRRAKDRAGLVREDFIDFARWTCIESLRAGITTIGATEDTGASLEALRDAGMRGVVFREVFGPDPAHAKASFDGLRANIDVMRELETDLVRVGVSPHAPYTVSDDLYRLTADYARTEKLPLAAHIAESEVEAQLVMTGEGVFAQGLRTRGIETARRAPSSIALLEQNGVLATSPLLIHCVRVDADDIALIADSGSSVAHCPVANARLGHGSAPVAEMDDAGINIAVGTDSVASNNRIDMLEEARAAQLMQRVRLRSSSALPAERLLRMVTIDAARALRIDARVGSLEAGKDADICALRIDASHNRPAHDPLATLFMSARAADVILTAVRGEVLFRDGTVSSLDEAALRPRINQTAARMRAALHTT